MAGESLKVVAGNATGSSIPLETELVIGRSTPGLGSLGGDTEISRVHARVFQSAGQVMVEDLGSTNGTFVNGNRITGTQPLRPGDQLRVGQTTMTVEGGADAGATSVGNVIPAAAPPPQAAAPPPPTQPLPPAQPPAPAYAQQQGPGPGFAGGPIGGAPQAKSGGSSKAPWYALAAVVLIALIVGGLAIGGVFGGDDKKKTSSNNAATTTPATTTTTPTTPTETTPAEPPPAAMPEPPEDPPPSSSGGGYPPGFIDKLVDSCESGGKLSPSQCRCWFGKLEDAYTFPELVKVLQKAKSGTIPPKAVSLLRECLNS